MRDQILSFYTGALASMKIQDVSGEGFLSSTTPATPVPITIGGKRLCLPTREALASADHKGHIFFHPLSEDITCGESEIIKSLKEYIQFHLSNVLMVTTLELMRIAASPDEHKKLGPKASLYLKEIPDCDEKVYKALDDVLHAVDREPERRLVSITLRQGSKGKDTARRSATVHFPIFDDLDKDDLRIFGVKLPSKKAKLKIAKLFEIVLGDVNERSDYSFGSPDGAAPYLHALLTAYSRVAARLNGVILTHKKMIENVDDLLIDLSWTDHLDHFSTMRGVIPAQKGNQGAVRVDRKAGIDSSNAKARGALPWDAPIHTDEQAAAPEKVTEPRNAPAKPSFGRQAQQERAAETAKGGISVSDFLAGVHNGNQQKPSFQRQGSFAQSHAQHQQQRPAAPAAPTFGRGGGYGRGANTPY